MDYCSSCRRHLNGALVCPGCGAYAPDIAPVTHHGGFDAVAAQRPARPEPHPFEPFAKTPAAEAVLPPGEGRAARRRQRARWRKSRRKAVLATTVALVGGGLAVSTLEQGSGHRAEAATAPDLTSTGNQDLPAQQYTVPTATQPGTGKHRAPSATDGGAAAGTRQPRTTATPDAPHTASERTRPYSAPRTAPTTQPRTTAHTAAGTASGTSGTPAGTGGTTPSPSATPGSGTSSAGTSSSDASSSDTSGPNSSGTNASQPDTTPTATSPSSVCVLGLLCLG
ncbi:hypothetical protein ACIRPX_40755 [Streptomyces sp. NPDC101225]|uniref:SCO2400 family protein n=1 Tax=Streptomyces sp. NPDC101225 TaxID=3366135 RepID=UPI00381B0AC9